MSKYLLANDEVAKLYLMDTKELEDILLNNGININVSFNKSLPEAPYQNSSLSSTQSNSHPNIHSHNFLNNPTPTDIIEIKTRENITSTHQNNIENTVLINKNKKPNFFAFQCLCDNLYQQAQRALNAPQRRIKPK